MPNKTYPSEYWKRLPQWLLTALIVRTKFVFGRGFAGSIIFDAFGVSVSTHPLSLSYGYATAQEHMRKKNDKKPDKIQWIYVELSKKNS